MRPFPLHQRPSGWQSQLPERTPHPPLKGSHRAEVVIIGAGYTGVACARAWQALRPDARVVMLDAEAVGDGSPGRNSGFMLEIALANDVNDSALAGMRRMNDLSRQAMDSLRQAVADHGIECGLARTGTYRAARGPKGLASIEAYRRFLTASGLAFESLEQGALTERLGTTYYAKGLYSPDCWLVQPAALIRGLVDALPAGITCFEHTPARTVERDGGHWRVQTPEGELTSPHVVLANNAFSRALGADGSRLATIYTYAALTPPLADALRDQTGGHEWGLLPAHRLGCTLRTTADHRMMIRSFYSLEREQDNARIAAQLHARLTARFPALGDTPFDTVWGGTTGLTYNGAPLWGAIAPGLHVSAGCNGGGIVKGTLLGEALAHQALDVPCADIHGLFGTPSWMPPAPLRRLGFEAISLKERYKGRHEA
ncbi:NAD(P)/FAD-dependent oxidoreductase [Larsenimonas rhizosphaerae]|uniref:FAD-dependent oxidoreductase n=1 Tax=Larsenimonas rhizosphaerae TaxID=2944682 RepID=A0AA41ZM70_9GAMM|nr:FAD-dependent oxidoreductase [Larsenimonas rhizosphaerae]MCX2524741.1 FAD-dependent oxidoreductase [Larsenimonas rhizosphaerae]